MSTIWLPDLPPGSFIVVSAVIEGEYDLAIIRSYGQFLQNYPLSAGRRKQPQKYAGPVVEMISASGWGSVVLHWHWHAFLWISISPWSPFSPRFLVFSSAVSHNHHFRLWEEGAAASLGVQKFAELGLTVELMKAGKEARKKRTVGAMQRTAGIPNGIGHSSTEVHMQPRSSLVSTEKDQ